MKLVDLQNHLDYFFFVVCGWVRPKEQVDALIAIATGPQNVHRHLTKRCEQHQNVKDKSFPIVVIRVLLTVGVSCPFVPPVFGVHHKNFFA